MLRSYLRLTLFTFGLLVGIQVPGFIEAYAQHVEARRLEAEQGLRGFQETARRFFNGDLDALVRHYRDSTPGFPERCAERRTAGEPCPYAGA